MLGDSPNQTVFDACGGSMAFTIAAIMAGHSVIVSEANADQLFNGKNRLVTEATTRLDARQNHKLKNLPWKHMFVHKEDEGKDTSEARFLPKPELLLGYDCDAPAELLPYRKICAPLKVRISETFFCFTVVLNRVSSRYNVMKVHFFDLFFSRVA